jgi:PKD repeat protein
MLFVFGAGNWGNNNDLYDSNTFYPASYPYNNIISVAASDQNDNRWINDPSQSSNFGAESVDLAAPGSNIFSTYPRYLPTYFPQYPGYSFTGGTSMATPYVSGVAGLILSVNPDYSPIQIKNVILQTVDRKEAWNGVVASGGRLNAHAALNSVPATAKPIPDFTADVTHGTDPLTVHFEDKSQGAKISSYIWYFGNGNQGYSSTPPPQIYHAGPYSVTLRIYNGGNLNETTKTNYIIVDQAMTIFNYIFPSAETGGSIEPSTLVQVVSGGFQLFTITPNPGYDVDDVVVNGESKGPFTNYNLTNITANSTITARFKVVSPLANFTANRTSGPAPLTVQFTDTSTGSPTVWFWNFGDGNTTNGVQHPVHTYLANGAYTVSLNATSAGGSNSTTKTKYICAGNCKDDIGAYSDDDGIWVLDYNGNFAWDGDIDKIYSFGGPGNTSVVGDWNGDRKTEAGVYNNGTWYLDFNGNGVYEGPTIDRTANLGSDTYKPIVGDWNGDGRDEIGSHKDGFWTIDYNGNYTWDGEGDDRFAGFGQNGDIPVVGDWNGDGRDEIGSHKDGFWTIDYNGNYEWDGEGDDRFAGFGQASDNPVVGDWNSDGLDEIGMEINGFWAIDYNGNYIWDGQGDDRFAGFGQTNDTPVVGDWNSDGSDEIASYKDGFWSLDYNGNYVWDGDTDDKFIGFGGARYIPVAGKW